MTLTVRLILAALAVYRLGQLVAIDNGPLDVFRRLRAWAVTGFIGGLVHCPYCVQVYAAVACGALVLWPSGAGDVVLTILGIAGAAAYLQGPRDAGE
jgi:hypothetical protein